jgi:hypothetical protein
MPEAFLDFAPDPVGYGRSGIGSFVRQGTFGFGEFGFEVLEIRDLLP